MTETETAAHIARLEAHQAVMIERFARLMEAAQVMEDALELIAADRGTREDVGMEACLTLEKVKSMYPEHKK